jgi:indole-3-acetate monooxygenase
MPDYVETTIDAIRTIQPRLASRAAEYELARRIPPDVVAELQRLGVFRMNTPKSHGGLELPLRDSLAIVSEIARVDGSLGWVCALNGFAPVHLGQLPRQTYDLIYRDGPDVKVAGSGIPGGTAEVVDGGYQVTGRWPFVSGCNHADWIGAFCVATRNGIALQGPSEGMPAIRIVVLPAKNWQIEDTWFAEGLKGTGSHHIALKDVRVPESQVVDPFKGVPSLPGPLFTAGPGIVVTSHAAFAVGLAEGAVQDLINLTATGHRPALGRIELRNSPTFQYELGRVDAHLRAARSLMWEQCDKDWQDALAGRAAELDRVTRRHQAVAWVTETCAHVIGVCFRLGGGIAVFDSSPLQRRLRDINAAAQHAGVHTRHYLPTGAQILGHPPVHPLFAA